jgi:hypothetical protein
MTRRVETAMNLVEDISSTFYKCTLSAANQKLNASGHMMVEIFFCVLVCVTHAQIYIAPFSYIMFTQYLQFDMYVIYCNLFSIYMYNIYMAPISSRLMQHIIFHHPVALVDLFCSDSLQSETCVGRIVYYVVTFL